MAKGKKSKVSETVVQIEKWKDEQIAEMAAALQAAGTWYVSKSKGPIKLSDMHVDHVWNAYARRYCEWLESLVSLYPENISDRITAFLKGPQDPVLNSLYRELISRSSNVKPRNEKSTSAKKNKK